MAITGSNGKTTHKELLKSLLGSVFPNKVFSTQGNFNNHIGVPLTILSVQDQHEILILEIGTNHPGEIKFLCDLINPDAGLITNIGSSHLEFFKNKEGVFQEKKELYNSIRQRNNGFFVANRDDPFLSRLEQYENFFFFSKSEEENFNYQLKESGLIFNLNKKSYHVNNNHLFGEYNYANLFGCFFISVYIISR